jgi:hypothetical protein
MTTIAIGHPGLARKFERKRSKNGRKQIWKFCQLKVQIYLTCNDFVNDSRHTPLYRAFPAILTQFSATCVDGGYNEAAREQF